MPLVKAIKLQGCQLDASGLELLVAGLRGLQGLQELDLSGNMVCVCVCVCKCASVQVCMYVCASVQVCISTISLPRFLTSLHHPPALPPHTPHPPYFPHFSGQVGDDGGVLLGSLAEVCPSLARLRLSRMGLSDESGSELLRRLSRSNPRSLSHLVGPEKGRKEGETGTSGIGAEDH
jgi:hypothetical protein